MFANGIIFSLKSLYRKDIVLYIYFTDKPVDFFSRSVSGVQRPYLFVTE